MTPYVEGLITGALLGAGGTFVLLLLLWVFEGD